MGILKETISGIPVLGNGGVLILDGMERTAMQEPFNLHVHVCTCWSLYDVMPCIGLVHNACSFNELVNKSLFFHLLPWNGSNDAKVKRLSRELVCLVIRVQERHEGQRSCINITCYDME